MHCSGPNNSPDPRWALICCFNARSNAIDPIPVRSSRPLGTLLSLFFWLRLAFALSSRFLSFVLPWVPKYLFEVGPRLGRAQPEAVAPQWDDGCVLRLGREQILAAGQPRL